MKKITMDGKYQTRNGKEVRVLCVDFRSSISAEPLVVAAVTDSESRGTRNEQVYYYYSTGGFRGAQGEHRLDLVPKTKKVEKWVAVIEGSSNIKPIEYFAVTTLYDTKEEAEAAWVLRGSLLRNGFLGTHKITIEVPE